MLKQKNFSIQTILDKKAFTLVELIVVITILAILWTIAFISLTAYSAQSRDSVRISDLDRMKTVLELYQIDSWKYPLPTNPIDVTYSWATVWNQGTFWETVYANLSKLDKIPKDPLTDKEYTYSTTFKKNEYQLWWILEGEEISYISPLIPSYQGGGLSQQVQAWTIEANAIIVGNYNGQMTKSLSWAICSILATPSIIASDVTTSTDLQSIVNNWNLVYRWFKNLPSSFFGSKFKQDWWFDFTPNSLLSYTDTTNCDALTSKTSYAERVQLLAWLQNSYSGTIVQNEWEIKNILSLDITDVNNPSNDVINYAGNFVNNTLWGKVVVWSDTSAPQVACTPSYTWSILWTTWDNPYWITVDTSWNIYVANSLDDTVTKITPSWVSSTFWTTWVYPLWITIDSAWNIYTANNDSNTVTKITPAWVSSTFWTTWVNPSSITIDSAWNIYTANDSNTVTKITPAWVSSTLWTTWVNPSWITVDSVLNIYTSNYSDNTVTKITPAWVSSILWTTWVNPSWISIDSAWNIYTANAWDNTVTKITPSWVSTIFWTTYATPFFIEIDPSWNLFISHFEWWSWDITKITPSWITSLLTTWWEAQKWMTLDDLWNIYVIDSSFLNVIKLNYSCN